MLVSRGVEKRALVATPRAPATDTSTRRRTPLRYQQSSRVLLLTVGPELGRLRFVVPGDWLYP
jgi:hypothetical protein